jgi:hypothetical protein
MKTFETLNIDSFDGPQFIVALDEKLGIVEQDYGKLYDEITFPISRNKMDKIKISNLENRIVKYQTTIFFWLNKHHEILMRWVYTQFDKPFI